MGCATDASALAPKPDGCNGRSQFPCRIIAFPDPGRFQADPRQILDKTPTTKENQRNNQADAIEKAGLKTSGRLSEASKQEKSLCPIGRLHQASDATQAACCPTKGNISIEKVNLNGKIKLTRSLRVIETVWWTAHLSTPRALHRTLV